MFVVFHRKRRIIVINDKFICWSEYFGMHFSILVIHFKNVNECLNGPLFYKTNRKWDKISASTTYFLIIFFQIEKQDISNILFIPFQKFNRVLQIKSMKHLFQHLLLFCIDIFFQISVVLAIINQFIKR